MCVPSVSVRTFREAVGMDVSKASLLSKAAENTEGRVPTRKMENQTAVASKVLSIGQNGENQMQITMIKSKEWIGGRSRLCLLPMPGYCLPWSISSDRQV